MNLLSRLHNWAHRQDENFLTEAFSHLCRHLLENSPEVGVNLLFKLTDGFLNVRPADAELVTVTTQATTAFGRPDIEIKTSSELVYVEVKSNSGLGHLQLERYRKALNDDHTYAKKQLALVTRYAPDIPKDGEKPDCHHRWFEIADWLESANPENPISCYLVNQFLDFLKERNISVQKVEWTLVDGSKALRNLLNIMDEAIKQQGIKIHRATAGWEWIGYYLDDKKSFIGFYFDEPDMLKFEAYYDNDLLAEQIDQGESSGCQWYNYLSLTAESTFFFSREKSSQLKVIGDFLNSSYAYSEKLRNP